MLERYACSLIPKLLIFSKAVPHKATRSHICFAKKGASAVSHAVSHGVLSFVSALVSYRIDLSQALLSGAAHTQTGLHTKQLFALAASGAVLGPLCDGQHSRFGVLHYTNPSLITLPGNDWQLETCWYFTCFCLSAICSIMLSHYDSVKHE